jgi:hypothetical protein
MGERDEGRVLMRRLEGKKQLERLRCKILFQKFSLITRINFIPALMLLPTIQGVSKITGQTSSVGYSQQKKEKIHTSICPEMCGFFV